MAHIHNQARHCIFNPNTSPLNCFAVILSLSLNTLNTHNTSSRQDRQKMEEEDTTSSTVPATSFRSAAGACSFRMDGNNNNNGDSERRRVLERNTSPSFCRRSQNFSESSLSQSIRQLHIQEAEEVLKDDPNDSTPPLERPANYRDFLKASRNRRSSIDQEVLIRVQKQQQEEERQKRQSRRRRSSTSSSNNNKQNHKNFMQRNEDNILGNGGTKGDVVVGIEEEGDDDDDDDEEEGKETPQPNEYVTTSKAQQAQAHAQQTADDTKDMRRMYRTMSVMNGRFMKSEDAAAWESMVHELVGLYTCIIYVYACEYSLSLTGVFLFSSLQFYPYRLRK